MPAKKTKKCSSCGKRKKVEQFHKHSRTKDGLQSYCKACQKKKKAQWHKDNPERYRNQNLKKRYGITVEQVDEMVEAVGGRCPGCLRITEDWHVDHNHDTGEVRGVLCGNCNRAAGLVGDNPAIMLRLAEFYSM